jgi:hypothetical protein
MHPRPYCLQVGTVFQPMLTYEQPPTYHRTGKVTGAFQDIVDAYGGWWGDQEGFTGGVG